MPSRSVAQHQLHRLVVVYPVDHPVSRAARFVGDTFARIATDLVAQDVRIGQMLDLEA